MLREPNYYNKSQPKKKLSMNKLSGLIFRKNRPIFILPEELPQEKFKTQSNFAHRNFDRAISF